MIAKPSQESKSVDLSDEIDKFAGAMAARFEELVMIREFASQLDVGHESLSVIKTLLDELLPCIGAQTLAVTVYADHEIQKKPIFAASGEELGPVEIDAIRQQATQNAICPSSGLAVANHLYVSGQVQHVVVVPVTRGRDTLGYLAATRDGNDDEFGTIEADLMKSVATMLAVHLVNQRQYLQLQQMFECTIEAFVCAIDAKDPYTRGHSNRVSELSVAIASRMGCSEAKIENIRMGALLHDVGKIGVEDAVLRKPGRLTDDEYAHIKQHPVIGYEIIKGIPRFEPFLSAIRSHHECWDGSGYPDGLVAGEIPFEARVIAVADAFDAMTSDRPYRRGMSLEAVSEIMADRRGIQWSDEVVDALMSAPRVMARFAHLSSLRET